MTEQIQITAEVFAKEVHRVATSIAAVLKTEPTIYSVYAALTIAHQGASVLPHAERVDFAATLMQMAKAITAPPPADGEPARQDVTLEGGLAAELARAREYHAQRVRDFHISYRGRDGVPHSIEDLSAAIAHGDAAQASGDTEAQVKAFERLRGLQ